MRIEGGSVLHPGVPNPQNNLDHKKSSTAISKEMKELVWVICLSVVFCFHFRGILRGNETCCVSVRVTIRNSTLSGTMVHARSVTLVVSDSLIPHGL